MLLVVLICWPIAEVLVAIEVARLIGVLYTVLLLIVSWPLGMWALRAQGTAAWRRLAIAVAQRRAPGREVLDGALVLVGGALLIVPGFITDVIGGCMLLPPTRALMRGAIIRNTIGRLAVRTVRVDPAAYDVEGTVDDVPRGRLGR